MKWNWGTKLVVAMAVFMGFIIVLVIQSAKNDVNLVEKDYYPKGLKYQDRLDEIENAAPFQIKPDTGSLYFFRPSDTDFDKLYKLEPNSKYAQFLPKNDFQKGKYLVKIYWQENNMGYYVEKPFYFN